MSAEETAAFAECRSCDHFLPFSREWKAFETA